MNAQMFDKKDVGFKVCSLAPFLLLAVLLTACSSQSPASQPPASLPVGQIGSADHAPVILRVEERQETKDGFLWIYQDVYFSDPDGDAAAMTYQIVSSDLPYPVNFTDDPVEAASAEQKGEALITWIGRCWQKFELAFETRIRDEAGNMSEPVLLTMTCTTPPVVDTKPFLVSGLITGLPIALLLGLGFWLLFRKKPEERMPAIRSTLLLFCLTLLFQFIHLVLHEGGHSLYLVSRGIPVTLYVHPFLFAGYSRPTIDNSVWKDILGSLVALPLSMLISLPFWRRRSLALLPLVMLFPWFAAFYEGINILGVIGDFRNLVQTNGLSPIPFFCLGTLIILGGLTLLFALFPLLGLDPKDKKALFILPAAAFLWGIVSLLVAVLVVPGSPIDRQYFLAQEILSSTQLSIIQILIFTFFALLYVTLYRRIHPKLPAWLRTEKVALTWKDLRLPAILAAASIILGLIVIT